MSCWLIVLADQAAVLRYFGLSWETAIIDSVISNFLLLFAGILILQTLRYYLPRGGQYINIFSICLILTVAWFLLIKWLLSIYLYQNESSGDFLLHSSPIRFGIGFLLLGCVTLIGILWYTQQEQKDKEEIKRDAEKMAKEAELFKLRQQLQPHFLFNSLNSINALIGSRPEEARKMVHQLSDFLRGTLKKDEAQWISLQEELQYLELYLGIEKVRFGNRLSTKIQVTDNVANYKLPALLLQPLMENAIKFGLYDTTGETMIQLYASEQDKNLLIKIMNPYDPETSAPQKGTGFGLQSVKRRLYLLFARNDLLTTQTHENTFITIIKIPQQFNEESNNHR